MHDTCLQMSDNSPNVFFIEKKKRICSTQKKHAINAQMHVHFPVQWDWSEGLAKLGSE